MEIAVWLNREGAKVRAFDPQVAELPEELRSVMSLGSDIAATMRDAEALVVMTPWPEFRALDPALAPTVVFDAGRFLEGILKPRQDIRYYSVGRAV